MPARYMRRTLSDWVKTSSTITSLSSLPSEPEFDITPPINRRFRPEYIYPSHFTLRDIEIPRGGWVYLACPHSRVKCSHCGVHVAHTDSIVIAMDAACRNMNVNYDNKSSSSALGVFCGFWNPYNRSHQLTGLTRHTSQIAELKACVRALCQAGLIGEDRALGTNYGPGPGPGAGAGTGHGRGRDVRLVIIKSDSEYVVRGVTELMPRWKANGWRNSRGVEVANADEFRVIERLVGSLWRDGIEVRFWLVPKGLNRQANGMARNALTLG
ncbi:ribonuclease H-like domain-containing protein [Aspergillus granulosus]|uniref:ribonuclease H n=1 Tax=Aspergillus granulosus TaxID=176169 RepID=A0ABR4HE66_9EURO